MTQQNKLRIVPPPVVQNEILSSPATNIFANGESDTKKASGKKVSGEKAFKKKAKTTSKRPSKARPQLLGAETTISNIIVGNEDDNRVFVPKNSAHSAEPDLLSPLESEVNPPQPYAKEPEPVSSKSNSNEPDHDRLNWDKPDSDELNIHHAEPPPVMAPPAMAAPPPSLSIPELPINHTGTLGSLLRTRRESLGLPMDQVSSELRISRSHLYNLEADEYQKLPARAYAIGFVQAYAKHLGLDPLDITARFKQEIDAEEISQPTHQFPTDGLRNHVPGKAILAGSILLAALVYFIWLDSGPRSFVETIPWFSSDDRAFMDENPSGQIEETEVTTEAVVAPIEADQPAVQNTDTPNIAALDATTPEAEIESPAPAAADPLQDPPVVDTQMADTQMADEPAIEDQPVIEDQASSVQIADIDVPTNQPVTQPDSQAAQDISATNVGSTGFADPTLVADANVWIRVLDAEQTIIYQGILLKEQRLPVQPDWRMTYSDGANLSLWIGAENIGKLENKNGITAENVLVQSRLISQ